MADGEINHLVGSDYLGAVCRSSCLEPSKVKTLLCATDATYCVAYLSMFMSIQQVICYI